MTTRDEAIAIVKPHLPAYDPFALESEKEDCENVVKGIRLALEALAAAGAFVDECCGDPDCYSARKTMAAKLDAARFR